MITVEFVAPDKLAVRIVKGSGFTEDLERVKAIPGRKWNKTGSYWELDWFQLTDLCFAFRDNQMLLKDQVTKDLRVRMDEALYPWRKLPAEFTEIPFSKFPKPYQERYVRMTAKRNRTLCAFEQGCGKTFTALERAKFLGCVRLLIVCPKVVCANWRTEVRAVLGRESVIFQGTKAKRAKQLDAITGGASVVICTYETAAELQAHIFPSQIPSFDQIIIDEAHLISNPDSKRFKDVVSLVRTNKRAGVQCLSGTPMQHRIKDIWALFHVLNPLLVGGYDAFKARHMKPIRKKTIEYMVKDKKGKPVLDENGKPIIRELEKEVAWRTINLHLIDQLMESCAYRVKREDVVDFDDAVEIVTVELTRRQRSLYEKLAYELALEYDKKVLNLRDGPVRMLRLLQAAEGVFNFDANDLESGKLEYIRHVLDNTNDKVIVWSRFKPITEILGRLYADRCVVYNGDRSDNYKQFAKWSFNGLDSPADAVEYEKMRKRYGTAFGAGEAQFFFGTIDMRSSLGMNLHADCSRQIFSSFSWMPAANAQAADRLRRIGQQADRVRTEFLVGEDTFESFALLTIMRNFKDIVEALDGKAGVSWRENQRILGKLKEMCLDRC